MRVAVLASGSGGNATVVEGGGTRVLIDCGLGYRALQRRMHAVGFQLGELDAVVVTHEHADHVSGLAVLLRHYPLPLLATGGTAAALEGLRPASVIAADRPFRIGGLDFLPVATSHDAAEPIGVVADHEGCRVGIVTDTGVVGDALAERLAGCHGVFLESNHDPDMLRYGPYPWPLKQRIASATGHLSNHQARAAVERLCGEGLELVVGMHLSRENNRPELASRELGRPLAGSAVGIAMAGQDEPIIVEVRGPSGRTGQLSLFAEEAGAEGERVVGRRR